MRKLTIAVLILIFTSSLLCLPVFKVVKLADFKNNKPLLYMQISDGQEFIIKFTHSVNKRPVYDYIKIVADNFVILKSCYDSFGAGMPETTGNGGTIVLHNDGRIEFNNINRIQNEIRLFSGTVSDHHIIFKQHDIALKKLIKPGSSIKISVERISLWHKLTGRCLYE